MTPTFSPIHETSKCREQGGQGTLGSLSSAGHCDHGPRPQKGRGREAAVGGSAPLRHTQLVCDEKLISSQHLKTRKRNRAGRKGELGCVGPSVPWRPAKGSFRAVTGQSTSPFRASVSPWEKWDSLPGPASLPPMGAGCIMPEKQDTPPRPSTPNPPAGFSLSGEQWPSP